MDVGLGYMGEGFTSLSLVWWWCGELESVGFVLVLVLEDIVSWVLGMSWNECGLCVDDIDSDCYELFCENRDLCGLWLWRSCWRGGWDSSALS